MSGAGDVREPAPDVLVCGGGMAGLCAALAAAEAGARVLVIEKGIAPGGSMRMSGGTIWTAPSMDVMERWAPGGDAERKRLLVDGLAAGVAWLEGHGIERTSTIESPRQVGVEVDVARMTDRLCDAIRARGGQVQVRSALRSLERDDDGAVSAVEATVDGRRRRIAAGAVVLATGGFGGSRELTARYISRWADTLLLRANPWSVGDGLLAALAAGARTSANLSTFYGHTMPAPPADPPPSRWTAVTAYYSQDALLVNARGERFFDESMSMADERAPAEIVQQPGGRAALVLDDRVYRNAGGPEQSSMGVQGLWEAAADSGAPHTVAGSIDALAEAVGAWGISPVGLRETLERYNAAIAAGTGHDLPVPRRGNRLAVTEAPFRALLVRAGITFTLGGIDTDAGMRVLDRDGAPIRGLYAAGADAGGVYQGGYMGGLVLGLVHGRVAGHAAALASRGDA